MIISLYAGLLALFYMALSVIVIIGRYKNRVALGDAGSFDMQRRIRAHANFIEYTPLFLIIMGYAEFSGLSGFWVHNLCGLFLVGRVSHAASILKLEKYKDGQIQAYPVFRTVGMVASFTAITITACNLISHYL